MVVTLSDGSKVVVSTVPSYRESTRNWAEVLRDLRDRGLNCPRLVVGDGHLDVKRQELCTSRKRDRQEL